MNCFYHQERAAVGICKNCQRGLCPECVAEVAGGLACKNKCENQVTLLSELVERNIKDSQVAKNAYRTAGTVNINIGIAMGILAAIWHVIWWQLKLVPLEIPAFKYISVPFWLIAAILVLTGISQRKRAS